eukprot:TRINITY_DN2046_c0_g1_i3.p1 TRINITY_DN2046_c0_g1~~TRINITY_DN2046_c0_g1_i3.p1  ORF type:complete len:443 (-),score=48.96 TRINITY_DN2046_c0_g1_i3:103-1431(-)
MLAHSISLETLVINEILRSDEQIQKQSSPVICACTRSREDFTIRNLDTTQTWAYTSRPSSGSGGEGPNIIQGLVAKIYLTCRTLVSIFFISNLTSLVLRTLFVTAPVFLFYPVQWFAGTRREAAFNKFCADYPWIGLYAYSLKNNGGRGVTTLLLSYIGFLVLVFTGYQKGVGIVDWLFLRYFPRGLETRFKLCLVLFETLNQLFVRTRTSIEYFPVVYIAGLICFVHYVNSTAYGLYSICLCLAVSIILAFFFYLLLAVEIPAITTWDPNQGNTPSESKPRAMFFPLFSMEWIHDLPQFWTAFFPLWGRSQFTLSQLSFVDRVADDLLVGGGAVEMDASTLRARAAAAAEERLSAGETSMSRRRNDLELGNDLQPREPQTRRRVVQFVKIIILLLNELSLCTVSEIYTPHSEIWNLHRRYHSLSVDISKRSLHQWLQIRML